MLQDESKRKRRSFVLLQVQDLAQASPATVSRCGMVYVDPGQLKWMPYVKTWLDTLSDKLRRETRFVIGKLICYDRRFEGMGVI